MRIAFAGTPTFAAVILAEMLRRRFNVVSVLTQPNSLSGRGMKEMMSPVKKLAREHNIVVQQPASLRHPEAIAAIAATHPDVLVVVAYGLILPPAALEIPRLGCLNVHASLLPRWRGAAPIQRAIMAGDMRTGVCIMHMDAGLDTGPVYACRATTIATNDTTGTLHDRLATLGADVLCDVLGELDQGSARALPQPSDGVTYASKILKADTRIDWARPAVEIERQLRALDPSPGAQTAVDGQPVKLWRGTIAANAPTGEAGVVVGIGSEGIDVRCGEGVLRVTELQRAGGRRLPVAEFLRGFRLAPGDRFDASPVSR